MRSGGAGGAEGGFAAGARPADVPQRIGRFLIRAQLGAGSFGAVYRALDETLKREVALKLLHRQGLENPEVRLRFQREAEAAAQLHHPHIVPVHDVGEDAGRLYIAAAFIEGTTLEGAIKSRRKDLDATDDEAAARLPPLEAAQVLKKVAEALSYAHGKGIVHRDVKPANIMVDRAGEPYLADFGLARQKSDAEPLPSDGAASPAGVDASLTQMGRQMGTPCYMSPEQAAGRNDLVGPASDQFAVGVMLYEMLCGRRPFDGPNNAVLMFHVRETAPELPHALVPGLPLDVEAICLKALAKNPADRYADCSELAADLGRFVAGEPVRARRLPLRERAVRWFRRNPAIASLTALAALLLLTTAVVSTVSAARQAALRQTADAAREKEREALVVAESQKKLAQEQQRLAETSARTAEEQRKLADVQRGEAEKNAKAAQDERRIAEAQKELADENARVAMRRLYASQINLADRAWGQGGWADVHRMMKILEGLAPAEGAPDLRGFEWHYLNRLRNQERLTVSGGRRVVFSRDGTKIATGASYEHVYDGRGKPADGRIKLWNAETGQEFKTLKGHPEFVDSMAFSPDGTRLASSSVADRTIRVWNIATGEQALAVDVPSRTGQPWAHVAWVAYSLDGAKLLAGAKDGRVPTLRGWNPTTGEPLATYDMKVDVGEGAYAYPILSEDLRVFASNSMLRGLETWDAPTGKKLAVLESQIPGEKISVYVFSPDGARVAAERQDPNGGGSWVRIWDAASGKVVVDLSRQTGDVRDIAFSSDGRRIAVCCRAGVVRVSDAAKGRTLQEFKGFQEGLEGVAFSPDGRRLAAAGSKVTKVFDLEAPDAPTMAHRRRVEGVAFHPDGVRLASVSAEDDHVRTWDVTTERETRRIPLSEGSTPTAVAYDPKGGRIAAGVAVPSGRGLIGMLSVWDASTGTPMRSINAHVGPVYACVFSPDGRRLAAANVGAASIWDADTGKAVSSARAGQDGGPVAGIPPHSLRDMSRRCCTFSPDGKRFALAEGKSAAVRDSESGKLVWRWRPPKPPQEFGVPVLTTCAAFSPDGRRLAVNSGMDVVLLDAASGEVTATIGLHAGMVSDLAFSPDGRRLAGAIVDSENSLKIWDAEGGMELLLLQGHEAYPSSVEFSADGRKLASTDSQGKIRIWDATPLEDRKVPPPQSP